MACALFPPNVTAPAINCGAGHGWECIKGDAGVAVAVALAIPIALWLIMLCLLRYADPLGILHVGTARFYPLVRFLLLAPKCAFAVVFYAAALAYLLHRYIVDGPCTQPVGSWAQLLRRDVAVFVGLGFNCLIVPILRIVYELDRFRHAKRRAWDFEVTFTCAESCRQLLAFPVMDAFFVLTPLLGAVLFPEGYQLPTRFTKPCVAGWGCEFHGATATIVGVGCVVCIALLIYFAYAERKHSDKETTRHLQWICVLCFPLWLAWYCWCVVSVFSAKSEAYRGFSFFRGFSLSDISTGFPTFDDIPTIAIMHVAIDVPAYLCLLALNHLIKNVSFFLRTVPRSPRSSSSPRRSASHPNHRRKKSSIRPGSPTAQAVYMVTRVRKGGLPTAVIHPCPHWPVNVRAGAVIYVPNSPTTQATSANQSLVDNSSCLLYPVNITQPQIVCWSQVGVECLKVYLVVIAGLVIGIPIAFWLILRWVFKRDALAIQFLWWKNHRELVRLCLNAPRALVSLIIYLIGFGRIVDKYVFAGTCRNDGFSKTKDKFLLVGMAFNVVIIPLFKCVYEFSFATRRDDSEITFSRTEEWRRKLTYPFMDFFLTVGPLLGAVLFPEGYQPSESTGRTCLRGWGCEVAGSTPEILGIGSIVCFAILVLCAPVYWFGEAGGKARHGVHWVFLFTFPLWLAWFGYCCVSVVMHKSAAWRELNYFASFDMHDVNDPQYFSYVPAFAIVDFILNIPCYLIMGIVLLLTYAPVRTQAGSTRRVAPKSVGPKSYNQPQIKGQKSSKKYSVGNSPQKVHPDISAVHRSPQGEP